MVHRARLSLLRSNHFRFLQLDIYSLLLDKNGYPVRDFACLVYYFPKRVLKEGVVEFNIEMVKAGLAEVYRGRNVKGLDMEPFWNTEEEAKKAGVGIWSLGGRYPYQPTRSRTKEVKYRIQQMLSHSGWQRYEKTAFTV